MIIVVALRPGSEGKSLQWEGCIALYQGEYLEKNIGIDPLELDDRVRKYQLKTKEVAQNSGNG